MAAFGPGSSYGTRIREHLRESIILGDLRPGERINEVQLASQLGVSRTPLREALAALASDGWIELVPHRGARVAEFKPADIDDLLAVRWILELGALDLIFARNLTQRASEKLGEAARLSDRSLTARKYSADPTSDFHLCLLEACQNPSLMELGESIHAKIKAIRFQSGVSGDRREDAQREHRAIVNAISTENRQAAESALQEHLSNATILMRK